MKKRRLPSLGDKPASRADTRAGSDQREQLRSRAIAQDWAARPSERPQVAGRVLCVAHDDQARVSIGLAAELCAAFVREGAVVGALVTVDTPARAVDAEQALAALMEAGAHQAKLLRRPTEPGSNPRATLESALAELGSGVDWVIAWGNALPQLLLPSFTVVVTGHRRALTGVPLVMQAQLEVTAPGPELASVLARRLVRSESAES